MLVDEKTAIMTDEEFNALPEYSCSFPTGQTIGKRWVCKNDYYDESKGWMMAEYIDHPNPKLVGIMWRDLEVV